MQEWASGAATKVSITIIGRPEKVRAQQGEGDQVMLLVFAAFPISALPKGLPRLSTGSRVLALVAAKQWKAVEPVWANDANERLVIEGYPVVSRQFAGITLLITKCQAASQLRQRQRGAQADGEA
jgi:hypothetical protein